MKARPKSVVRTFIKVNWFFVLLILGNCPGTLGLIR